MVKIIAGIFFILHALVHLLYFGQSARLFELKAGMTWPDSSWAFSKLLGDTNTRTLAIIFCILAATGFVISAGGIFFSQSWWRTTIIVTSTFSIILFIQFWNGRLQQLDSQGGVGILIDAAILAAVVVFHWPQFNF